MTKNSKLNRYLNKIVLVVAGILGYQVASDKFIVKFLLSIIAEVVANQLAFSVDISTL